MRTGFGINKELRTSINRARNLLHTEFPEAKNSKFMSKGIDTIWAFIAGKPLPKNTATRWKNRLSRSIGTAKKHRFSTEITRFANSIWQLQTERANIKQYFNDVLENPQYIWYKQAFDKLELEIYDRIIFLCQLHPFEQFIDSKGKELRIEKKRHTGKAGKPITRRVGLNKFHSKLGKAVYPWSSGEKIGHIVNGSTLARSHLYLWANRNVVMNARVENPNVDDLRRQYEKDTRDSIELITELAGQAEEDLESVKIILANSRVGKVLLPLLEEALSQKKNPIRTLKSRGKQALGQWAKSRVGDRLVKILFKELIAAWRKHHL